LEYKIKKLDDKTYMIMEYNKRSSVYMYLLEGDKKAILIDSGFGTIPLDDICGKITDKPIDVVLTHGHADHIGSSGLFDRVFLHEADSNLYRENSQEKWRRFFTNEPLNPVKDQPEYFKGEPVFELGNRTISIIETPGHSKGSVCLLDAERKWLFTGDTCCKAHVLLQGENSGGIELYNKSVEKLLSYEKLYEVIWPGHHSFPVDKSILHQFFEATEGLMNGTLCGVETDLPMGKAFLLKYKDIGVEY